MEGLNKAGGISFTRKKNFEDKVEEVEVEPEEPKIDIEYEARQLRLSKKHKQAKVVNYSGFAVNGRSILALLYGINNIMLSPDTIEFVLYSKSKISRKKEYGFNGVSTVVRKVKEGKKLNLTGIMFWRLAGDVPVDHEKSLLRALSRELNS